MKALLLGTALLVTQGAYALDLAPGSVHTLAGTVSSLQDERGFFLATGGDRVLIYARSEDVRQLRVGAAVYGKVPRDWVKLAVLELQAVEVRVQPRGHSRRIDLSAPTGARPGRDRPGCGLRGTSLCLCDRATSDARTDLACESRMRPFSTAVNWKGRLATMADAQHPSSITLPTTAAGICCPLVRPHRQAVGLTLWGEGGFSLQL